MRVNDTTHLCSNCIRRPVDCILRGHFCPELASNFICRSTGQGHSKEHSVTCHVGHLNKYCPKVDRCEWCVEAGDNCSACALARALPFVNVAAVNTVFKCIAERAPRAEDDKKLLAPPKPDGRRRHGPVPQIPIHANKIERKERRVAARQISMNQPVLIPGHPLRPQPPLALAVAAGPLLPVVSVPAVPPASAAEPVLDSPAE